MQIAGCREQPQGAKRADRQRKTYVKYLGELIDGNLSWKQQIDYISMKTSKGIGIIARLDT